MSDKTKPHTAKSQAASSKDRQYQKFVAKARELETDESEEHFDQLVKKIVKAPQPKAGRKDEPSK